MLFYSSFDQKKCNPLVIDDNTLELPWFFKFYLNWHKKSLAVFLSITAELPNSKTVEVLLPVLEAAKVEIGNLSTSLPSFFPDWLILRPLNNWLKEIFTAQADEVKQTFSTNIDQAKLKTLRVKKNTEEEIELKALKRKLDPREKDNIKKSLKTQISALSTMQSEYQINIGALKLAESELQCLQNSRVKVPQIPLPLGRTITYGNYMMVAVTYAAPSPRQLQEFEEFKKRRIQSLDDQIKTKEKRISDLREQQSRLFFPARKAEPQDHEEKEKEKEVEFTPN
ncbi:hypothetical protein [Legionella drozanskii]|uniref:Uncharacterized protein n=1 Tax=Legionella drozanskii LLAP-1 TaxID=1212489 RepID=A0A0W0SWX5_9GAMM|nr:hypothetical protein [Legionella drozanskii]KTC87757.1 hypothetical protein Ldro_1376 [Legionella drozanskii LLAP-1]